MRLTATRLSYVVLSAGVLVTTVASIWAPAQPEVFSNGGACEIDMCGMLEDPQRWRPAWILWGVGALATLTATAALARPRPGTALLRIALAVLIVLCIPITAVAGYLVSHWTSMQGFATVMWIFTLLPLVAFAIPTLRAIVDHVGAPPRSDPRHAAVSKQA